MAGPQDRPIDPSFWGLGGVWPLWFEMRAKISWFKMCVSFVWCFGVLFYGLFIIGRSRFFALWAPVLWSAWAFFGLLGLLFVGLLGLCFGLLGFWSAGFFGLLGRFWSALLVGLLGHLVCWAGWSAGAFLVS